MHTTAALELLLAARRWTVLDRRGGELLVGTADGPAVLTVQPPGPPAREAVLTGLRHEHLAAVLDVAVCGPDRVVVAEQVAGTPLDELLAARAVLAQEEAATVAIPIARALGVLHGAGLAHGRVEVGSVVLRPTGEPVLTRPASALVATTSPVQDVRSLVALVLGLLAGEDVYRAAAVDDALRAALTAVAARPDPTALDVVDACFAAVDPQPVCLPEPVWDGEPLPGPTPDRAAGVAAMIRGQAHGAPGRHRAARRTRRPRTRSPVSLVVGVVTAVVAVVVLAAAATWSPRGSRAAPVVGTSAAALANPATAAAALTEQRAAMLADPASADLAAVEQVGGPAHAADQATLAALHGGRLVGLAVTVSDARTAGVDADGAVRVVVTSTTSAATLVAADGSTALVPSAGPSTVELVLHATADGWRVWQVSATSP